jgi:hypothetical protein
VIGRGGARIAIVAVAVAIVGASLTGCAHNGLGGRPAPAAGVNATTAAPAPATGSDDSSLQSVQNDLDSADSATTNAGGDVADADSSAATNDSP